MRILCVALMLASTGLHATGKEASSSLSVPLSFEKVSLPGSPGVEFIAHQAGSLTAVTSQGAAFAVSEGASPNSIRMRFVGANPSSQGEVLAENAWPSHFLIGRNPGHWRIGIKTYQKVLFRDIYPGIHVVYYGKGREFEYDLEISANADLDQVSLQFEGLGKPTLDASGDLVFESNGRTHRSKAPIAFQMREGKQVRASVEYRIRRDGSIGFRATDRDPALALIVDPVLIFSSAVGGSGSETEPYITTDAAGNIYIAGTTTSTNFIAPGPLRPMPSGKDSFVAKFNPTGTTLLFATYLGGNDVETTRGLQVDSSGNIYVAGDSKSYDFPVVNSSQPSWALTQNSFLSKINPAGNAFVFSTLFGGNADEFLTGLAVDRATGISAVTGFTYSENFPTTPGAFQTTPIQVGNGFVVKYGATGSVSYSSLLGDVGGTLCYALDLDSTGAVYVTGTTSSSTFPTTAGTVKTVLDGLTDAFITKFTPNGAGLAFSTLLGGAGQDSGSGITRASDGGILVSGWTSSGNFPLTAGAVDSTFSSSGIKAFVSKLNSTGSALLASTYFGGSRGAFVSPPIEDGSGNIVLGGSTRSVDLLVNQPLQGAKIGVGAVMYRSADQGLTWTGFPPGTDGLNSLDYSMKAAVFSPANSNRAYAHGSSCIIYASSDKGAAWMPKGLRCLEKLVPHPTTADTVLGVAADTVYRSTDGGALWWPIFVGVSAQFKPGDLAISPSNPLVLYVGSRTTHGIYKSVDGANSWMALPSSTLGAVSQILISPTNHNEVFAAIGGVVYKSVDGGTSWNPMNMGHCCTPGLLGIHPTNASRLYQVVDGVFYRTADGGSTWSHHVIGAGDEQPTALSINPSNPQEIYVGFPANGIFTSSDEGATWSSVNGTQPFRQDPVRSLASTGTVVLAGFETQLDGFVAKLNPSLSTVLMSSYFGMKGDDYVSSVLRAGDDLLVAGYGSQGIPVVGGAYESPSRDKQDVYFAKIADGNGGCTASISPNSLAFSPFGGTKNLRAVTGGGCAWSVSSISSWLTAGPTSGSGLGSVDISAAPNNTGAPRNGSVTINGVAVSISQPAGPPCTIYSIDPPVAGGPESFSNPTLFHVEASSGCLLTATSDSPWATVTHGASFTDGGYIGASATANTTSTARTATITVASWGGVATATTKIQQSGASCSNSLTVSAGTIGAAGGTVTVQFNTSPTGCAAWTAGSSVSWATLTSAPTGTGSAAATFAVAPNRGLGPRTGALNVGGQVYTLTQLDTVACPGYVTLNALTTVNGTLGGGDCPSLLRGNGIDIYHARRYSFTGIAGQRFAVEVKAKTGNITPIVYIVTPDRTHIFQGDPAGERKSVRVEAGNTLVAPVSGSYLVEVTSDLPLQTGTFDLRLLPQCDVTGPSASSLVPQSGGSWRLPVAATSACSWVITNFSPSDLTLVSADVQSGSQSVAVQLTPNTTTSHRKLLIHLGNVRHELIQPGTGLVRSFSPSFRKVPATAGDMLGALTAPFTAMEWPAATVPWISVTLGDFATGAIGYAVEANTGGERVGKIILNGAAHTVVQAAGVPDKIGIYANGAWVMDLNGNGTFEGNPTDKYVEFGNSLYSPVLGDWMAQAKTSMAIFYNGLWYADFNQNRQWDGSVLDLAAGLGGAGWTPISGDWDGDGTVNIGVYNNGSWYLDWNGDMKWEAGVDKVYTFGGGSATPIVGDWNLDGKTEIGAYINGLWYLDYDGDGAYVPANDKQVGFGVAGFLPVIGDWNGDGRSKIGIVRNGEWYVDYNGNFQFDGTSVDRDVYLGTTGWLPVIGDWNGDGRKKIGIFKDGQWILDYNGNYLLDGPDKNYMFGAAGQKPIVGKW